LRKFGARVFSVTLIVIAFSLGCAQARTPNTAQNNDEANIFIAIRQPQAQYVQILFFRQDVKTQRPTRLSLAWPLRFYVS
jgi:hypothetical protein